jgi:hypothetical protein
LKSMVAAVFVEAGMAVVPVTVMSPPSGALDEKEGGLRFLGLAPQAVQRSPLSGAVACGWGCRDRAGESRRAYGSESLRRAAISWICRRGVHDGPMLVAISLQEENSIATSECLNAPERGDR